MTSNHHIAKQAYYQLLPAKVEIEVPTEFVIYCCHPIVPVLIFTKNPYLHVVINF